MSAKEGIYICSNAEEHQLKFSNLLSRKKQFARTTFPYFLMWRTPNCQATRKCIKTFAISSLHHPPITRFVRKLLWQDIYPPTYLSIDVLHLTVITSFPTVWWIGNDSKGGIVEHMWTHWLPLMHFVTSRCWNSECVTMHVCAHINVTWHSYWLLMHLRLFSTQKLAFVMKLIKLSLYTEHLYSYICGGIYVHSLNGRATFKHWGTLCEECCCHCSEGG